MNYHNRKFRPESTSDNGEVDTETVFHYQQHGNVLTCSYASANIQHGQLIGLVDDAGNINMRYQQVNAAGQLRTGTCQSTPEVLPRQNPPARAMAMDQR